MSYREFLTATLGMHILCCVILIKAEVVICNLDASVCSAVVLVANSGLVLNECPFVVVQALL
jgi:hypothetical protein